jgi:hypothetical protein
MRMRSTGIFLAGALAGAGILSLATHIVQRTESTELASPNRSESPQLSLEHSSRPNVDIHISTDEQARRSADKPQVNARSKAPVDEARDWNALVGGMLEWEVERRTGQKLDGETRERLVSELGRLRETSLALQESPATPGDPAELRERLTRTLALVQIDQTFRNELGVGVAEFLQGLNSGAIEDVPPVSTNP